MEKKPHIVDAKMLSLRKVCLDLFGDDKQLCDAVSFTVSADPTTLIQAGANHYVELAKSYEKGKDPNPRIAGAHYWNAGRVAMFEGNLDLARECFLKYAELNPDSPFVDHFKFYKKKESAEKALKVAQEYYKKTGQRV
jgi:tetratricopeptide (TPR) repeat protein